jgi:hypothetical protein
MYNSRRNYHGWVILQDQFIENIFSSGMLMYVSSNWLAELYQHVLVTNILVLSGYKIQAIGHLALIDLLSGSYWVCFNFQA